MTKWYFREMQRAEMSVNPVQSEFFSTEAIEGLTEALVRESIQNTLDAAQTTPARIRFWLSGSENAIPSQKANQYFGGLEEHLNAKGSGLQAIPSFGDEIPFLLVEDFNARGLCGSPSQDKDVPGASNDFYYFWRNVGRSGKGEKDRGRWGVGKTVFPAASRINSFFGFTVRNETPQALLMGQSVLKVHQLDGSRLYPYGYFGTIEGDGFAKPIETAGFLDQFRSDFSLARKNEPGLSVIVPFPDEDITAGRLLKATLRQYFYPIMAGKLVVTIGNDITVDQDSLAGIIDGLEDAFKHELQPVLRLAQWAIGVASFVKTKEPPADLAPKWESDCLSEETIKELRPKFEQGERLAFEVPVKVKPKDNGELASFFKVFLERDESMEPHRATFVREGLIVTDAVKNKTRGVRALVVISDKPLATMLGDAENPAHTEWQERSANFKDRYLHGRSTLSYVKTSVTSLVQILTQSKGEEDYSVLQDIFFLAQPPTPEDKRKTKKIKPKPGMEPPITPPLPPPAPPVLRVSQVSGGFTIVANKSAVQARVIAAYEIRRGNAFKRYQPADFELDKAPIQVQAENTEIMELSGNTLVVGPLQAGSKVTVTGFDGLRDLAVRATAEVTNDTAV